MEGLQENGQHAVVSDQVPESTFFPSFFFSGRKRIALSLVFLSNIFFIMPHIRYALICTRVALGYLNVHVLRKRGSSTCAQRH